VLHEGGRERGRQIRPPRQGNGNAILAPVRPVTYAGPLGWLERLEQIQGRGGPAAIGHSGNLLAAFVIHAAESVSSGKLVLDFWPRRQGPGGQAGPLGPGRAPDREFQIFADTRDQELVSLLSRTGGPKTVTS